MDKAGTPLFTSLYKPPLPDSSPSPRPTHTSFVDGRQGCARVRYRLTGAEASNDKGERSHQPTTLDITLPRYLVYSILIQIPDRELGRVCLHLSSGKQSTTPAQLNRPPRPKRPITSKTWTPGRTGHASPYRHSSPSCTASRRDSSPSCAWCSIPSTSHYTPCHGYGSLWCLS